MFIWQREVERLTVLALLTLKSVPNVRMEEAFFCVCPASKCIAPLQLNDSLPGSWQVSPPVPWLHMHHWNEILRPRFTLSYFSISFLRFYHQTPIPSLLNVPYCPFFIPQFFIPAHDFCCCCCLHLVRSTQFTYVRTKIVMVAEKVYKRKLV